MGRIEVGGMAGATVISLDYRSMFAKQGGSILKNIARLELGLVIILGILLVCSGAFANGNSYGGPNGGYNNGGERHYYRDGRWYKHDQRGNEVSVADIVVGAIAEALPPQHQTVIIQNTPYYYDNSHYYQRRPDNSYIVVEPPRRY